MESPAFVITCPYAEGEITFDIHLFDDDGTKMAVRDKDHGEIEWDFPSLVEEIGRHNPNAFSVSSDGLKYQVVAIYNYAQDWNWTYLFFIMPDALAELLRMTNYTVYDILEGLENAYHLFTQTNMQEVLAVFAAWRAEKIRREEAAAERAAGLLMNRLAL